MSPAEIEKLKALRPGPSLMRYAEALEEARDRLLEERERLLEAAKLARGHAVGRDCGALQAAIMFATAPAGKEEK